MKVYLLMALMVLTIASRAQNILVPGKGVIEKKWVRDGNYQMNWFTMKDSSMINIGNIDTRIVTDKSNITIITRVNFNNMKTPWVDSTVASLSTLSPIRHSSYNSQRDMVLNFGKIVTGYYTDKSKKTHTVIRDTLSNEYFDSNIYPVLIGWLPLGEDYRREISIYDYNPAKSGLVKATVNNVRTGSYESAKSGTREVWIVSVTDEIGGGPSAVSLYYFDKKDRKLWKQEISIGERKMVLQLAE